PPDLPLVRPAKGEIIALHGRVRPFERIISTPGGSISARSDGRMGIGATVREAGFDKVLTADSVSRMIAAATEAGPCLPPRPFLKAWTGLHPRTPDDQPIIGPDPVAGYFWATGHFKMGILSAPATAEVIVDLIQRRKPPVSVGTLG